MNNPALSTSPQEITIWDGSPSQWLNIGPFLIGGLFFWLLVPAIWALWRYLEVRCTRYRLTNQRLAIRSGVFNIRVVEVEHYRIKDYSLSQPFIFRFVGIGNVELITSDQTYEFITLRAVRNHEWIREELRKSVEAIRDAKRVRQLDLI